MIFALLSTRKIISFKIFSSQLKYIFLKENERKSMFEKDSVLNSNFLFK